MKFGWTANSPEYKAWRQWLAQRYHSTEDNLSQPVDTAAAAQFDAFLGDLARRVANNPGRPHYVESSSSSTASKIDAAGTRAALAQNSPFGVYTGHAWVEKAKADLDSEVTPVKFASRRSFLGSIPGAMLLAAASQSRGNIDTKSPESAGFLVEPAGTAEPRGSRASEQVLQWPVARTAIIICDMWNTHLRYVGATRSLDGAADESGGSQHAVSV